MTVLRRVLGGKPYTFTENPWGWQVTSTHNPTDRMYRTYQVQCGPTGTPLRCSCPDCVFRAAWCKHLKEVEKILEETQPPSKCRYCSGDEKAHACDCI